MDDTKYTKHESFGVIEVSRVSGNTNLVGSEIEHQHFFSLTIKEAEQVESFGHVQFFGHKELISVFLSANQLIDMITMTNTSNATCCTIRHIKGVQMEKPPKMTPRIELASEYGLERIKEDKKKAFEMIKQIEELTSGLPKKKQEEIARLVNTLVSNQHENGEFYVDRIKEATEKSVQIAKIEVESFVSSLVRQLGIKSLAEIGERVCDGDRQKSISKIDS